MARIKPQALLQQSKKKKGPSRMSVTTILFFSLSTLLVLFCVFSTYKYFSQRASNQAEQGYYTGRKGLERLQNSDVPRYAVLKTSKGAVTIELFKDNHPEIVDEFIYLCEKGHFKGMQFHRIIRNFLLQVGDVHSLDASEDWTSKMKQNNQLDKSMNHEAFMFGTSKRKRDTKGFELYITTAPIPDLSEKIIVFGQVVKGVEVVQEIEEVDTDEHYEPKSSIALLDVTLEHTI